MSGAQKSEDQRIGQGLTSKGNAGMSATVGEIKSSELTMKKFGPDVGKINQEGGDRYKELQGVHLRSIDFCSISQQCSPSPHRHYHVGPDPDQVVSASGGHQASDVKEASLTSKEASESK